MKQHKSYKYTKKEWDRAVGYGTVPNERKTDSDSQTKEPEKK